MFVDGRDRIDAGCDCQAVISGDAIIASIAAASIVAKVTRDRLMTRLGLLYPGYGFEHHKGYSVPEHFEALARLGPTIHHRRSFAPVAAAYGDVVTDDMDAQRREFRSRRTVASASRLAGLISAGSACRNVVTSGLMLYVSIFVELLAFAPVAGGLAGGAGAGAAVAAGSVAVLCRPAGRLPNVLAVGHEFQLGTYLGPPLAFWLAELAFDLAGRSLVGVYLLSQACVVVTYWAVFALATLDRRRAARGARGVADGGRCRLHGADAGLRAGDPHHAAVGDHPVALLAGGGRGPAGLLAAAGDRDRAACCSRPMSV